MGGRLREMAVEIFHDRGGILQRAAIRGGDRGHDRQTGDLFILRLVLRPAHNPLMGHGLVAEIGPGLHRVRRHFRTEDDVGLAHEFLSFLPLFRPVANRPFPPHTRPAYTESVSAIMNRNSGSDKHGIFSRTLYKTEIRVHNFKV